LVPRTNAFFAALVGSFPTLGPSLSSDADRTSPSWENVFISQSLEGFWLQKTPAQQRFSRERILLAAGDRAAVSVF
jgi:hypothetical protein